MLSRTVTASSGKGKRREVHEWGKAERLRRLL